jgi:hypothetical protein
VPKKAVKPAKGKVGPAKKAPLKAVAGGKRK